MQPSSQRRCTPSSKSIGAFGPKMCDC